MSHEEEEKVVEEGKSKGGTNEVDTKIDGIRKKVEEGKGKERCNEGKESCGNRGKEKWLEGGKEEFREIIDIW